jgi:Serine dehydrogenase proteinase
MPSSVTRYNLVIFQCGPPGARQSTLRRGVVANIIKQLDAHVTTPLSRTEIEIWLDSPGGDAHATYKLLLDLRQRCGKLTVVIPDYAKSAATLLVLGCDEIWMAPSADLGPLDVQIAHPDRETEPLSGLDIAGSFSYLSEFAMQLMLTGGATLKEATGLPRLEVLKIMQEFTAQFLRPCMEKIDPHVARRTVYQLKVAERYAETILELRNVPEALKLRPEASRKLVKRLVHDYPVHEFCISRTEMQKLGLPIHDALKHPRWKLIKSLYDVFSDGDTPVIRVMKEAKATPPAGTGGVRPRKAPKQKAGSSNGQNANIAKTGIAEGADGKKIAKTRAAGRF